MDGAATNQNHVEMCAVEQEAAVWKHIREGVRAGLYESKVSVEDINCALEYSMGPTGETRNLRLAEFQMETAKQIGDGNFAVAYIVKHRKLKRPVVLKMFLDNSSSQDVFDECTNLLNLRHNRVINLLGYFFEGNIFLVFPTCLGDLDIYRPRLNAKNRLRSYIQVMEGLSFIHSRDMIHCDIKPENILVTTNGNFVISDFGEAVMLKGCQSVTRSTIRGTLNFLSEEVLAERKYSKSSDLWGMACTIFTLEKGFLLVSCLNPEEEDTETILKCIKHGVPERCGNGSRRHPIQKRIENCEYKSIIRELMYNKRFTADQFFQDEFIISQRIKLEITPDNLDTCTDTLREQNLKIPKQPVLQKPLVYQPCDAIFSNFYYESKTLTKEMRLMEDGERSYST